MKFLRNRQAGQVVDISLVALSDVVHAPARSGDGRGRQRGKGCEVGGRGGEGRVKEGV